MRSRSRVPAPWTIAPAPMKASPFMRAWFQTWRSAPAIPSAASAGAPSSAADEADAEPEGDEPDVLDGGVGEDPLQVALAEREHERRDRAEEPDGGEREAVPRGRGRQEGEHPEDPVDPHLHEDPRHQRRDVARRGRVRLRQPDVERHQAGLRPEADEGEREGDRGAGARAGRAARRTPRSGATRPRCRA